MNDKLQKNPKGTYIRETREMAENAAKKNPECNFIGLDEYLPTLYPVKPGFTINHSENAAERATESVRTTYVKKKRSS